MKIKINAIGFQHLIGVLPPEEWEIRWAQVRRRVVAIRSMALSYQLSKPLF